MENTGSGKTCPICDDLLDDEDTLRCSLCYHPQHFGCTGVTTDDFKNALKDGSAVWRCPSCRDSLKTVDNQPSVGVGNLKSLEVAVVDGVTKALDVRLKKLERFQASQLKMHELLSSHLKSIQSELAYLAVSKPSEDDDEEEKADEKADENPNTEVVGIRKRLFWVVSLMIPIIKKINDHPCGHRVLKSVPMFCIKAFRHVFRRYKPPVPAITAN